MTDHNRLMDTRRVAATLKEVAQKVETEEVLGVFLVAYDPVANKMYTSVGIDSEKVELKDLLALVKRAADDAWAAWVKKHSA